MTHSLEVYFVMHSIFFILAKNNYVVQCFIAFVNIFLPYKLIFIRKKNKAEIYFSICRSMLSAVESTATQHLRLTLARQLAEVLLRGCSEHAYKAPNQGMRKLGG